MLTIFNFDHMAGENRELILENTLTKKENNISIEATEGEVCKM